MEASNQSIEPSKAARPIVRFYRVVRDVQAGRSTVFGDPLSRFIADETEAQSELAFWLGCFDDAYIAEYQVRKGSDAYLVMAEGC